MTSTTGPSPPPFASITSTVISSSSHPVTTSDSMVSSNSISGGVDDDEPIINGDSPPPVSATDLPIPPRAMTQAPASTIMTIRSPMYPMDIDDDDDDDHQDMLKSDRSTPDRQSSLPRQSINKRKNFKPMNIVYHYSDSEFDEDVTDEDGFDNQQEFPRSSPNHFSPSSPVHFRSSEGDRGNNAEQPLDLSSDSGPTRWKLHPKIHREGSPVVPMSNVRSPADLARFDYCEDDDDDDDEGCGISDDFRRTPAIDLSRNARDGTGSGSSPSTCPTNESPSSPRQAYNQNLPLVKRLAYDPHLASADGATMKDYAENTMKELLGMYGLNDGPEAATSHPSVHNYPGMFLF